MKINQLELFNKTIVKKPHKILKFSKSHCIKYKKYVIIQKHCVNNVKKLREVCKNVKSLPSNR